VSAGSGLQYTGVIRRRDLRRQGREHAEQMKRSSGRKRNGSGKIWLALHHPAVTEWQLREWENAIPVLRFARWMCRNPAFGGRNTFSCASLCLGDRSHAMAWRMAGTSTSSMALRITHSRRNRSMSEWRCFNSCAIYASRKADHRWSPSSPIHRRRKDLVPWGNRDIRHCGGGLTCTLVDKWR